jgi:UDP-N-acetylglucosamine--N-acetylmuramyl-(pentapeptide) pyrophosphoryl-undecaprenol N-acetylglucosamine transferase
VFGGSQGARAINDMMLAATPGLVAQVPGLEIWHQTGRGDEERIGPRTRGSGWSAPRVRVAEFLSDMATPYALVRPGAVPGRGDLAGGAGGGG